MQPLPKALLALVLVWGVVSVVVWSAGQRRVTPESIAAHLAKHPLDPDASAADREKLIRSVADQVNQLDYEQRQAARNRKDASGQPLRDFFGELRPQERGLFVELTIGPTFTHLMNAFNEMTREERQKIAQNAIDQISRNGAVPPEEARLWEEQGTELFEKVVGEGLQAYYQEANADTKLDFAPVLEAMQASLQSPRGRWKDKPAY